MNIQRAALHVNEPFYEQENLITVLEVGNSLEIDLSEDMIKIHFHALA